MIFYCYSEIPSPWHRFPFPTLPALNSFFPFHGFFPRNLLLKAAPPYGILSITFHGSGGEAMLETAINYIIGALLVLFMICILIWNFIHFGYGFKCRKVKTCSSRQCRFRHYCRKWSESYTEEEKAKLSQLIKQHRDKLDSK